MEVPAQPPGPLQALDTGALLAKLPPPHGLGKEGLGYRDGCSGKDAVMNALFSLITRRLSQMLTEVYIQCLGKGYV